MAKPTIRRASLEDIDFFLTLAKKEGWNPGLHDAPPKQQLNNIFGGTTFEVG